MRSKTICLSKIQVSDAILIEHIKTIELPLDWNEKSYLPTTTQALGQEFFEKGTNYILKVPSIIIPDEFNILLNPLHDLHKKTEIIEQIDPFAMDDRLLNR